MCTRRGSQPIYHAVVVVTTVPYHSLCTDGVARKGSQTTALRRLTQRAADMGQRAAGCKCLLKYHNALIADSVIVEIELRRAEE